MKNSMSTQGGGGKSEDIDLATILVRLWSKKAFILACVAAAAALGVAYSLLTPSIYQSQATISMKEGDKSGGAGSVLSQLGGLGGAMATQLGIGNTSLSKIEVILKGRDLADSVISQNGLLPKLFPDLWDSKVGAWKDSAKVPSLRDGIEALTGGVLDVVVDEKRKLIHIGINSRDPIAAKEMVDDYLAALNRKLVGDVRNEATLNRSYLEDQLARTIDPVLQEKISTMIASEMEKFMLVSSRSFEVLETAVVPMERAKPKRKIIVALSVVIGLMASITWVLASPVIGDLSQRVATKN